MSESGRDVAVTIGGAGGEVGRGIAVGLGFCAGAALVCSDEPSSTVGWIVKVVAFVWIALLTMALSGSMIAKAKDKVKP